MSNIGNSDQDEKEGNDRYHAYGLMALFVVFLTAFNYALSPVAFEELFWTIVGRTKTAVFRKLLAEEGERITSVSRIPEELFGSFLWLFFNWLFMLATICGFIYQGFIDTSDQAAHPDWFKVYMLVAIPLLWIFLFVGYQLVPSKISGTITILFAKSKIEKLSELGDLS